MKKYTDNNGNLYTRNTRAFRNPQDLTTSPKGIELIHHFESCKLTAYQDSGGVWTIGWGTTRYPNGQRVKKGDTITQDIADSIFKTQLPRYELMVKSLVKRELKQYEFDALVSFCYNAGSHYKAGNVWRPFNLWSHVNNKIGDKDMLNYWSKLAITAGGKVLNGLVRRRKSEAHLYIKGEIKTNHNA